MTRSQIASVGVLLTCLFNCGCGPGPQDPTNELPSGFVDLPAAGTILRPGKTLIGGWAVDDRGIAEVRVYFDGYFKGATTLAVSRPDVAKAMRKYARGSDRHGWNIEVDFGVAAGSHTILVQVVDTNGATRDIGAVPVTTPR